MGSVNRTNMYTYIYSVVPTNTSFIHVVYTSEIYNTCVPVHSAMPKNVSFIQGGNDP